MGDPDPAPVLRVHDGKLGVPDRLGQEAQVDHVLVQLELADDVVAGVLEVDEVILARTADHKVVAGAADQEIVSRAALEESRCLRRRRGDPTHGRR